MIVFWVAPIRAVVAASSSPQVKKNVRVFFVCLLVGTLVVDVCRALVDEEDLPLFVRESDIDPEIATPHLLNRLRDGPVPISCIIEQLQMGKSLALGKTGFGQKLLCFGDILLKVSISDISGRVRRDVTQCGLLSTKCNIFHELFSLDRHCERSPHPYVVERLMCDVQAVKIYGTPRGKQDVLWRFPLIQRNLRERN